MMLALACLLSIGCQYPAVATATVAGKGQVTVRCDAVSPDRAFLEVLRRFPNSEFVTATAGARTRLYEAGVTLGVWHVYEQPSPSSDWYLIGDIYTPQKRGTP